MSFLLLFLLFHSYLKVFEGWLLMRHVLWLMTTLLPFQCYYFYTIPLRMIISMAMILMGPPKSAPSTVHIIISSYNIVRCCWNNFSEAMRWSERTIERTAVEKKGKEQLLKLLAAIFSSVLIRSRITIHLYFLAPTVPFRWFRLSVCLTISLVERIRPLCSIF